KLHCIKFITENSSQVIRTEHWSQLTRSHPELVVSLFQALAAKHNTVSASAAAKCEQVKTSISNSDVIARQPFEKFTPLRRERPQSPQFGNTVSFVSHSESTDQIEGCDDMELWNKHICSCVGFCVFIGFFFNWL